MAFHTSYVTGCNIDIPLFKVFMAPSATNAVSDVLMSGYVGQGERVEMFEQHLREFLNCKHLLTVNSCTSALQLALHLVKEGTQVLTTPLTCFATTAAILNSGLEPKWVDVDPNTANIDLDDLEKKLTHNTKIIMVVHFAGRPVDLDRLNKVLDRCEARLGFRPVVIEDCAHAFGSTYNGKHIGSHGNICCFSFQAVKVLSTVDGGAIVLPNEKVYERAKKLRWFGLDRSKERATQDIEEPGFKYHMNDVNAVIGIENLRHIYDLLMKQQITHSLYSYELAEFALSYENTGNGQSNGWMFPVRVKRRDAFEKHLKAHGIQAMPAHTRNDTHSCVLKYSTYLPGMDYLETELSCIPSGWWVDYPEFVIEVINKGW